MYILYIYKYKHNHGLFINNKRGGYSARSIINSLLRSNTSNLASNANRAVEHVVVIIIIVQSWRHAPGFRSRMTIAGCA